MKANSSEWRPLRLLWNVLCIAAPTAMGNAFEYLPVVFGLSIVGHLPDGRAALEVVSLARAWFNMTALAPSFGLLTALRTLCPQAVGGGRPELNRLYIRRAFCFVALGAIPCCGLQWACAPTLTAVLGTPPALARDVQAYALRLIPQYFGVAGMTILQRVYQAHDMVLSNMAICGAVCAVAPLLQWAFVHGLGWGYIGIAWAAGTSNLLYVALQLPHLVSVGQGYLFFGNSSASSSSSLSSSAAAEDRGAWGEALSREGLWEYTVLMVPGFLQAVAEWSVLEFIIFAVSVLQQSQEKGLIAASAVVGNLQAVFIMAWIGFEVAAGVLVGRAIGGGDVKAAKRCAVATVAAAALCGCGVAAFLALYAGPLSKLYVPPKADAGLAAATRKLLKVLAGFVAVNALNSSLMGVLAGLGRQAAAAAAQLTGYYLVGVPSALLAVFGPPGVLSLYLLPGRGGGGVRAAGAIWALGVGLSMATSSALQLRVLLGCCGAYGGGEGGEGGEGGGGFDWSSSVAAAEDRLGRRGEEDAEEDAEDGGLVLRSRAEADFRREEAPLPTVPGGSYYVLPQNGSSGSGRSSEAREEEEEEEDDDDDDDVERALMSPSKRRQDRRRPQTTRSAIAMMTSQLVGNSDADADARQQPVQQQTQEREQQEAFDIDKMAAPSGGVEHEVELVSAHAAML